MVTTLRAPLLCPDTKKRKEKEPTRTLSATMF